jgi:hypothetical protein
MQVLAYLQIPKRRDSIRFLFAKLGAETTQLILYKTVRYNKFHFN